MLVIICEPPKVSFGVRSNFVARVNADAATCLAQGRKLPVEEYELRLSVRIGTVGDLDGNCVEFLKMA